MDEMIKISKPASNGFNVLCHGDFWSNNIMFKYNDTNEPVEIIFVDFQMCLWTSPAIDLLYLIITSAAKDIKIKLFDYFIQYYYSKLVSSLKIFNYSTNMPTLKELHLDVLSRGFYGNFNFIDELRKNI